MYNTDTNCASHFLACHLLALEVTGSSQVLEAVGFRIPPSIAMIFFSLVNPPAAKLLVTRYSDRTRVCFVGYVKDLLAAGNRTKQKEYKYVRVPQPGATF